MKKDLLVGIVFVSLAALGSGGVYLLLGAEADIDAPKTIKPKTEAIALSPPKAEPVEVKKPVETVRKIPIKLASTEVVKPQETPAQPVETKVIAEKGPAKKISVVTEPKPIELKKAALPAVKVPDIIELGNIRKINHPGLEYAVEPLGGENELILLGRVKTLKLNGTNGKSLLDASALDAQEIIFARAVDGDSRVKLSAAQGILSIQGEVTGSAQLEVIAPAGKVVFTSKGPIVSGGAKVTIIAKEVELNGAISGGGFVTVTISKGGSLKFTKLQGGAHLHYGPASARDPVPRLEAGFVARGTDLRKIPAKR